MIQLEHVSFTYGGAGRESLCDVSLSIAPGECVVITGKSGCGKTTLSRVLNGLCPKFYGGRLEGAYLLNGRNSNDISLDEMGLSLGSVFQDPRSQFFAKRVRDEVVLGMENHCVERALQHERLWEVSEPLGITKLFGREMANLSSGEKQKVAIASVCALRPQGLVLDEPSANLDTATTAHLAEFLRRLKHAGHTLVVSEHRLHYLRDVFDRLLVMENGKIVKEYTRQQALALPECKLVALGLRFFQTPPLHVAGRIRTYRGCPVQANSVSLRLADTQILNDVTLGCAAGYVTAITGSNGAGKTSLCKIITGMQQESTGAVFVGGAPARKRRRIRSSFLVQQDVDYQLYTPTVREEILLGTALHADDIRVEETVALLGLAGLLHRHPNTLSGGQKQRVLLAAAAIRDVPLLVLDEPTSGLDGYHMRAVAGILKALAATGKAVLLITHDLAFIDLVADSVVYMHESRVKYHSRVELNVPVDEALIKTTSELVVDW